MSFTDIDRPVNKDEYDHSFYYQNETEYGDPAYYTTTITDHYNIEAKKPTVLPTINYLNERKCPIYIHHIRNDSSVYNNSSQKTAPRKKAEKSKVTSQNASKFVLDKLEETYWATWKPKKENMPLKKKSPRKVPDLGLVDVKPVFRIHNKGSKKTSNKPHGDVNDNIIKYFKTKDFESSSTAASVTHVEVNGEKSRTNSNVAVTVINENSDNNKNSCKRFARPRKFGKLPQRDSVSQEIQTEVHCPVILEQINEEVEENKDIQLIFEKEETREQNVEVVEHASEENMNKASKRAQKQSENKNKKEGINKQEEKSKNHLKINKKTKKNNNKDTSEIQELPSDFENAKTFVGLKDSIEITKEKQEKLSPKEHYQQPKCIRLFRKSGGSSGYIKGGTYPLKSCLKKESFSKGNFRLGAPGSPLFITTNSFSNRRKK